jgi:hypothetical protein
MVGSTSGGLVLGGELLYIDYYVLPTGTAAGMMVGGGAHDCALVDDR